MLRYVVYGSASQVADTLAGDSGVLGQPLVGLMALASPQDTKAVLDVMAVWGVMVTLDVV